MATPMIFLYGTEKRLQDNTSAALATGNYAVCATAGYTSTDTLDYRDAKLVLKCTIPVATVVSAKIHKYARRKNVQGTNHGSIPSANYRKDRIGSFIPNTGTAQQYIVENVYDMPKEADIWIENDSGQTISAGWELWIEPLTDGY